MGLVQKEVEMVLSSGSLSCLVEDKSLMCLDEEGVVEGIEDDCWGNGCKGMVFYENELLSLLSEECLELMVKKEVEFGVQEDYEMRFGKGGGLDLGGRKEIVDWILKVHAHHNFGPLSAYLSISYLDRFLSMYELAKGKVWMMQLLGVTCLSLAAKMEETQVPLLLDLQVEESKFVFEARTIQRMELLVLSTLKWRMQAVTPFSFIDHFLWKINGDQSPPLSSISRSVELILNTVKGIDYLRYKPSEIAVAVAISVLGETQTVDLDKSSSCFIQHVEKERVLKCLEWIQPKNNVSVGASSVPQSPIGVLDAACLSYKSDELTVGSCANSVHSSPDAKRRKLNNVPEADIPQVMR